MLFAGTYPERTIVLVTFGVFAKRKYSKDYPWAPAEAERQLSYKMIEEKWADGDMIGLRSLVHLKYRLTDSSTLIIYLVSSISYLRTSLQYQKM